ncbi:MAG TPA: manganese efflux pump MntP family protein, partial [Kofleriaceae bacterium]|nr:manganese efflux pump MntP family protein [Kofleriaceae bacterium]
RGDEHRHRHDVCGPAAARSVELARYLAVLEAVILAIALAMDATAVATARAVSGAPRRDLFVLALSFGVFQAGMAGIGLVVGAAAAELVASWDHWLAFGLLLAIGGKMLWEALQEDDEDDATPRTLGVRTIVVLSIATSIDALAAGVTLPSLAAPPPLSLALIGVASFVLSALGTVVGTRLGKHLGARLEIVGGLALIGIGIKTLVDHLLG